MLRQSGTRLICLRFSISRQTPQQGTSRVLFRSTSSRRSLSHDSLVREDDWQWVPSLFARLLTAFGMAYIVSEYGVELTLCEGPSMLPTIRPRGEIILVDRLTPRIYGLEGGCEGKERVKQAKKRQEEYVEANKGRQKEHTWHQRIIPVNKVHKDGKWKRLWTRLTTGISVGDVVVVQHPQRHGTVCKRVLGLPGDVVLRPPPPRIMRQMARRSMQQPQRQTLVIVPDGHVWIEGDNSLNSSDSRAYGAVPAALIVGRVVCRIWPLRGHALLERGWRPQPPPGRPCSGSTVLPAGYEGEEILKFDRTSIEESKMKPV